LGYQYDTRSAAKFNTHELTILKAPEYVPKEKVGNTMVQENEKDLHRLYV